MRSHSLLFVAVVVASTFGCGSGSNDETPDASVGTRTNDGGKTKDASTSSGSGSSSGSDTATNEAGDDLGLDAGTGEGSDDATGDANPGDGGAVPEGSCGATAGPHSSSEWTTWAGDWSAGDYPPGDITAQNYLTISNVAGQNGHDRQYKVHVPPGYDKSKPTPALFCIHGLDQNAPMFCTDTGVAWNAKSDDANFVLIMPNGYQNSWNAGTCCGEAVTEKLDDVGLIRAIFKEVGNHVNIDLGRVYATGLSNGGYLSYRLACEASDVFVAVAPSAGAIGTAAIGGGTGTTSDLAGCTPTNKVSILDIHGTADPLIPYSTQAPSLALASANGGCSMTTVPAAIPSSGGDTTCVTYQGCSTCPKVEVTGCSIADGGHCWFGSTDCGTGGGAIGNLFVGNNSNFMMNTQQIWAFLSRLSR